MFQNKKFSVCEEVLTKVRIHDKNRSLKKIKNFSQLDFAILANVCFQIYLKFQVYPSQQYNNKEWEKFQSLVRLYITKLNYYKFLVNKLKYKKRKKILEYLKYFFDINFFKSYFVGHVLPAEFQKKFFLVYEKKFIKESNRIINKDLDQRVQVN